MAVKSRVVGSYELTKARGGAWLGRHRALGEAVVVKLAEGRREQDQVLAEGRLLHGLSHPGLPRLKELNADHDPAFLVLEAIEGPTLAARLGDGAPALGDALALAIKLASAVEALHNQQPPVVHGAIRPEHVILGPAGPVLLGFGATAAAQIESEGLQHSGDWGRTTRGLGPAELVYVAPEVVRGESPDQTADIYSLAVLLFEMTTARRPEPGDSPSDLVPTLPAELDELFRAAYCRREKRIATVGEWRARLETLLASHPAGGAGVASGPARPTTPPGRGAIADTVLEGTADGVETIQEAPPAGSRDRRGRRAASSDPMLGRRFGNCEVVARLGEGGMGAVYQARHTHLDKIVALKVLSSGLRELESIERFQREARTAASLEHPNIVTVYDFGEEGGEFYLTMRYVEGENLGDRLEREGRIAVPEALRIARAVADGLAAAHERGLIHRDIKPANILLSREREVLIADFGLAKPTRKDEAGVTATGAILGTPAYMAPEQCRGESEIDGRADLFSLGLTLYEMVTGTLPVRGRTALQIIHERLSADVPRARTLAPDVPPALDQLLVELLAREPGRRTPSARELLKRLDDVAAGLGVRKARPVRHRPGPDSERLRRPPGRGLQPPAVRETEVPEPPPLPKSAADAVKGFEGALAAGGFDIARDRLAQIESLAPGHPRLKSLKTRLERARAGVEAARREAADHAAAGELDEQLAALQRAAGIVTGDARLEAEIGALTERRRQRDARLRELRAALAAGRVQEAAEGAAALAELGRDCRVERLATEAARVAERRSSLSSMIAKDEQAGRYEDALERLRALQTLTPEDPALESTRARIESAQAGREHRRLVGRGAVLLLVIAGFAVLIVGAVRAKGVMNLREARERLAAGELPRARRAFERANRVAPWLLPGVERARLAGDLDAAEQLEEVRLTVDASERLRRLEAYLAAWPERGRAEAEALRERARADAADDRLFHEASHARPIRKRLELLDAYLAREGAHPHDAQVEKIRRTLRRSRREALEAASAAEEAKNWEEAVEQLELAAELGADDLEARLAKVRERAERIGTLRRGATQARVRGDFTEAIRLYEDLARLGARVDSDLRLCRVGKAQKAHDEGRRSGDWMAVVGALQELKGLGERVSDYQIQYARYSYHYERARGYERKGEWERAKREYEAALPHARSTRSVRRRISYCERMAKRRR